MGDFGFSPNSLLISSVVGGVLGFVLLVLVYVVLMAYGNRSQSAAGCAPNLFACFVPGRSHHSSRTTHRQHRLRDMDELGDEEMQINAFNRMPLGRSRPHSPKPSDAKADMPAPVYHRLSGLGICDGDDVVAWVRDSRLRRSWLLTGCSICLEPFQNHQLIRQLACGHPFHAMCIDRWFTQSKQPVLACPLCLTPDASAVHV